MLFGSTDIVLGKSYIKSSGCYFKMRIKQDKYSGDDIFHVRILQDDFYSLYYLFSLQIRWLEIYRTNIITMYRMVWRFGWQH
jgi:hypothetical protein